MMQTVFWPLTSRVFFVAFSTLILFLSGCNRVEARLSADKGYRAYLNKQFAEAIAYYDKAIKLTPDDKSIMRNLGYAHLGAAHETTSREESSRHYNTAIEHLSKLLTLDPNDKELAGVMLDAWTQADRLDEAARFYSDRANVAPKDPETLRLLGMIELRRGNYQQALDTYERRQLLLPNETQIYASKATLCWEWLRAGGPVDPTQALRVASIGVDAALEADRRDPNHPSALVYAGLLLRERAARQTDKNEAQKDLIAAQKYLEQVRVRRQVTDGASPKQISMLSH